MPLKQAVECSVKYQVLANQTAMIGVVKQKIKATGELKQEATVYMGQKKTFKRQQASQFYEDNGFTGDYDDYVNQNQSFEDGIRSGSYAPELCCRMASNGSVEEMDIDSPRARNNSGGYIGGYGFNEILES